MAGYRFQLRRSFMITGHAAPIYIRFLQGNLRVCLILIWVMILQIGLLRCLKNN